MSVSGTGYLPKGSSLTTITVTGWTTLRDQDGRGLSGSVQVSDTSSYYITGNFVSGWVRPYAYVSL